MPLLSLGYMCVEGWSKKEYNPGGVKVVTREYQHKPLSPGMKLTRTDTLPSFDALLVSRSL